MQEALDRVMVGRTTLVIAHRLSTIQVRSLFTADISCESCSQLDLLPLVNNVDIISADIIPPTMHDPGRGRYTRPRERGAY